MVIMNWYNLIVQLLCNYSAILNQEFEDMGLFKWREFGAQMARKK
jgi:hypothetical protein